MNKAVFTLTALVTLCCFALVTYTSCTRDKADSSTITNTPKMIEYQRIMQCHADNNPLPTQITAAMEGSWLWIFRECPFYGENSYADKQVVIKFTDAGVYTVTENTVIVAQGIYTLTKKNGTGEWQIEVQQPSEYLYGHIYICGNELLFEDSYRDGCNNLFEKR